MAFAFVKDGAITEYPVTESEIRRKFPGTSFPKSFDGLDLSGYGAVSVTLVDHPSIDVTTHKVEEGDPSLVDGSWQQTWNVIELTSEELQKKTESKAANARIERDQKLAACDWTVLADSPLTTAKKTEWKTYRTALRNISAAEGFPHTMEWPTEPS